MMMGTLVSHLRSVRCMNEVQMYCRPTRVQLIRGEFLETVLYWEGVVLVGLGVMAEKQVSKHSYVWGSVRV